MVLVPWTFISMSALPLGMVDPELSPADPLNGGSGDHYIHLHVLMSV
jgi:hypothetical protein